MKQIGKASAVVALVAGFGSLGVIPANAGTNACIYSDTVSVSNGHATGFKIGSDTFDKVTGSSGVTLTITAGRATSVATSLSQAVTLGVDAVVAKIDATTTLSLAVTRSTTTTVGGSWTVPSTQTTGWLAFGTFSTYSYNWAETIHVENCTTSNKYGTGVSPVVGQNFGFTHS